MIFTNTLMKKDGFLLRFLPFIALVIGVIIQVISFKTRKKRIFRMSPIHHHFELGGWSERKVVAVFTSVTVLMVIVSGLILNKGAII